MEVRVCRCLGDLSYAVITCDDIVPESLYGGQLPLQARHSVGDKFGGVQEVLAGPVAL